MSASDAIPVPPRAAKRGLTVMGRVVWILFIVLALVPALSGGGLSAYTLTLGARVMVFAIAALSLDLILGYGGMVSFGHAAFLGFGAYAAGILAVENVGDALIAIPVAIAASALFAALTGYIAVRTKGAAFIMITLAFGQMAFFLANSLDEYGGSDGLTMQTKSPLAGTDFLQTDVHFYYFALLCLVLIYLLLSAVVRSRFGRALWGCKEEPVRMAALGYNVDRIKLVAYVISGAVAGVAGFLLANQTEFVSPAYMTWQRSGELMFMVILGGMGTLVGPVLGAAVIIILEDVLSNYFEHWPMALGFVFLAAALFARGGLIRLLQGRARP